MFSDVFNDRMFSIFFKLPLFLPLPARPADGGIPELKDCLPWCSASTSRPSDDTPEKQDRRRNKMSQESAWVLTSGPLPECSFKLFRFHIFVSTTMAQKGPPHLAESLKRFREALREVLSARLSRMRCIVKEVISQADLTLNALSASWEGCYTSAPCEFAKRWKQRYWKHTEWVIWCILKASLKLLMLATAATAATANYWHQGFLAPHSPWPARPPGSAQAEQHWLYITKWSCSAKVHSKSLAWSALHKAKFQTCAWPPRFCISSAHRTSPKHPTSQCDTTTVDCKAVALVKQQECQELNCRKTKLIEYAKQATENLRYTIWWRNMEKPHMLNTDLPNSKHQLFCRKFRTGRLETLTGKFNGVEWEARLF